MSNELENEEQRMPALPGRTGKACRRAVQRKRRCHRFGADVERGARARRGCARSAVERWKIWRRHEGRCCQWANQLRRRAVVRGAGDGGDSSQGKRVGRTEQWSVAGCTAAGAAACALCAVVLVVGTTWAYQVRQEDLARQLALRPAESVFESVPAPLE